MADYLIDPRSKTSWQQPVEDKDLNTPPGSPSKGNRYIIASGGSFSWDVYTEDCADISDWSDADLGNGESTQVTFDSKSCFKFDTHETYAGQNRAARISAAVSKPTNYTVEVNIYIDKIEGANDYMNMFVVSGGSSLLEVVWKSAKIYIEGVEAGTNLIQQDIWQKWRFEVKNSDSTSATCDVYLNDELKASDMACYHATGLTDVIKIHLFGNDTADNIVYFDYIKVGTGFASQNWYGEEDNIAQYNGSSWDLAIPAEGWQTWIKDENRYYKYNGASWEQIFDLDYDSDYDCFTIS